MYTTEFKEAEVEVSERSETRRAKSPLHVDSVTPWSPLQRTIFRVGFVFFLILIVPWHPAFYQQLFSINWLAPHFKQLIDLATFLPDISSTSRWGATSFSSWLIYLAVAAIASAVWAAVDKRTEYNFQYYLLRVALRYKLGLGLLACGFYLFYQQQMPYPSLSNLHTNYGDMFAWKLYYQTTAINPEYQSFLGVVEIAAGILILLRRTVTLGCGVVIGFLGNVAMVNAFYDVGHHVYVNFLLLSAVVLFSYDVPRLYALFIKGAKVIGKKYYPKWSGRLAIARKSLRVAAVAFVALIAFRGVALAGAPYKIPASPGLKGTYGYYLPTVFKINNETIPYSLTDSVRWQDVIFEKWSTITIRDNRPIVADITDGDGIASQDIDRNYETAGSVGRHYFHYVIDSVNHTIRLQNKNVNHRSEILNLHYSFPTDSTIILKGTNEKNDSIYTELLRVKKKYFMYEGRRNRIKL